MSEENQPEFDPREPWEKKPWIVDPEFDRWVDQRLKEKQEALAANGYKPWPQEEGKWKVNRADVEEALRRSRESPIQVDPFEPDEYW